MQNLSRLSCSLAIKRYPLLLIDSTLIITLVFLPNLLMGINFMQENQATLLASTWANYLYISFKHLDFNNFLVWFGINTSLLALLCLLRRHIFYPMQGILKHIQTTLSSAEQNSSLPMLVSMRTLAGDIVRMTQLAQTYYHQQQEATQALSEVRITLTQLVSQQQTILTHTSREMITQYQSVLAYANYLEEQISRQVVDPALRYDFDDVSESSFNLKLIAGALHLIQHPGTAQLVTMNVPDLITQTMLALAPSLDRRSMKLTTVEVDLAVNAFSNPTILVHVLWMLLLGTVRYAADESTLRLRCLYNRDHSRAMISLVVSELSPGRLTEEERGAFMARQLEHLTPHMFAETIRIHANMQLAELLMRPLNATISILPLTTYSCEICLNLPVPADHRA